MRELNYAVIATAITLVLAIALYLYVPTLRASMRDKDAGLEHSREFVTLPAGGEIQYRTSNSEQVEPFFEDLELLARRFERGQFAMITLPGIRQSDEFAGMVANQEAFTYIVEKRTEGPTLKIEARGAQATQALHAYLGYLSERWQFTL